MFYLVQVPKDKRVPISKVVEVSEEPEKRSVMNMELNKCICYYDKIHKVTLLCFLRSTPVANSSQMEPETVDNHVQVLKSVPVNLSLNTDHQDNKREQYSVPAGESGTAAVVKAETHTPVFMTSGGHYRTEGEEHMRVICEQTHSFDTSTINHSAYGKDDHRSSPESTYEEDSNEVRTDSYLVFVVKLGFLSC